MATQLPAAEPPTYETIEFVPTAQLPEDPPASVIADKELYPNAQLLLACNCVVKEFIAYGPHAVFHVLNAVVVNVILPVFLQQIE